jgi:hypothetical protein
MSTPPRWPRAVFVIAMVVGAVAIALLVLILWAVSHAE